MYTTLELETAACYNHFYLFSFIYNRVKVLELLVSFLYNFLFSNIPVAQLKLQCVTLASQIYCHTQKKTLLILLFSTTTTTKAVIEVRKM